jgi:F0F1-type ATP synthase membrane subunit b/b'
MEEPKSKIENRLQYAEEMHLQLESSNAVIQERIWQARKESCHKIAKAKPQSKIYPNRQKAEIEQLTQGIIDAAKRNIEKEKAKM